MTIIIHTVRAQSLYRAINEKINNNILRTWEIRVGSEGHTYYNHSPEQWRDKVLLKPTPHPNGLQLEVYYWTTESEPTEAVKGYVLGRFTEILMVHFRDYFEKIELR